MTSHLYIGIDSLLILYSHSLCFKLRAIFSFSRYIVFIVYLDLVYIASRTERVHSPKLCHTYLCWETMLPYTARSTLSSLTSGDQMRKMWKICFTFQIHDKETHETVDFCWFWPHLQTLEHRAGSRAHNHELQHNQPARSTDLGPHYHGRSSCQEDLVTRRIVWGRDSCHMLETLDKHILTKLCFCGRSRQSIEGVWLRQMSLAGLVPDGI